MKNYTLLLFSVLVIMSPNFFWGQTVVINEFQSSNNATIPDSEGEYNDWIEIYNYGTTAVNLSGYGLTDDPSKPLKWKFPNVTLQAKQYLLVWASDKNYAIAGMELHTNFKLDAQGEAISLTNPSGAVVNSVAATEMIPDISYGRSPNGTGSFMFYSACTPGTANGTVGYTEFMSPPVFSVASGFYTQGFSLSISKTSIPGTVYYTLDGSEPNPNNVNGKTYSYKNQYPENPGDLKGGLLTQNYKSFLYSAPIQINDRSSLPNDISSISSTFHKTPFYIPTSPVLKGTVVKAKVYQSGSLPSPTITATYFVNPAGSNLFSLPVISLSLSEDDFYDYNKGIYVAGADFDAWRSANPTVETSSEEGIGNYFRVDEEDNQKYEIGANFSYFVKGKEVLNQNIGLKIHGGGSRIYQSKSLGVFCRSHYGTNSLDYKIFENVPHSDFKRLTLRNGGSEFGETMFRDALCQNIAKSLNCESESYQPTITFINGEYWGILNIREKYNDEYFQEEYNFKAGELDYLEQMDELEGDNVDYLSLIDYLEKNSLSGTANYEYIKTRIDIDSFYDYFITNIFLLNIDWPGNNIHSWRKRTNGYIQNAPYGHDGRWRWAFHDMDATFGLGSDDIYDHDSLADATEPNGPEWPNPAWSTLMLRKLLENNEFKTGFINRFADLLNTYFLPERIKGIMNEMKAVIEPEMPMHISRWKSNTGMAEWNWYLNFQAEFADKRPAFQRTHIRTKFNISADIKATVNVSDPSQGYVKINTIDILHTTPGIAENPYPWQGTYFKGVPVKLKAVAMPGYVFSHWSGASGSTSAEITLPSAGDFSITANFVPASSVGAQQVIYYWIMDNSITNNTPLTTIPSTFSLSANTTGILEFQSCLSGYPFTSSSSSWRKASMERRNSPTPLNYMQEVNNNLTFMSSNMRGIQIKQPFQVAALQNSLILNVPTTNYKSIKLDFAVMDEGAATGVIIDYATAKDNDGKPVWTTSGIANSSQAISTNSFKTVSMDFSNISGANNNVDFKIRIRFSGSKLTEDSGNRVTFNNISIKGSSMTLDVAENRTTGFKIYPNPVRDVLNISSELNQIIYRVYTIEGKLLKNGNLENGELDFSDLNSGVYMLELSAEGKSEMTKIIKM